MARTAVTFANGKEQARPKKAGLDYLPSVSIARLNAQYRNDALNAYESQSHNNGGLLGGLGYLGEKIAVGFMSSVEGIWDYSAGGLAKLFGADDWAEQQFANDWFGDWYSHPEEWYNPSAGWQTAGDIAGGIGTSLPAMGAVVIAGAATYFSGGTLAPAAAGIIAGATAGLGAAGTATKQAYRETGQLTGKEFGYGALSGLTEGGLEGVSTLIGMGSGQIIKGVTKSFAKTTAKTVAKQGVVKTLTKGFIGEAFEEGTAEYLDPKWQRLTYNPAAKDATPQEIAYATFVGGMSGMIMNGGNVAIDSGNSFLKGNSLVGRGLDTEVMGLSQQLAAFEAENNTGDETFQGIAQTYADLAQSLEATGGKVTTVTQKKLLGDLHRANTVAVFKPMIARSAANIVNNAEVIAERLNTYGYKTADGKSITFTAEQIRAGVDVNNPSSFSKALKTNSILRELAVADTTGHLVMDTTRFAQATLMGKKLASQVDLNRFIETATPSEINAVSQALGIENWATLDVDTFNQKITDFLESGGAQQYADRRATVQAIQAIPAETARAMPKMVNLRQDGSVRYSDGGTQIAITKQGDAYTVYDYASGYLSKNMTRSEVNKLLRDYNTRQADMTAGARAQMEAESELRRQAVELDTYARENIADYSKLSTPNQSMIRKVIREGRAKGMSDADVLAYAKISAHSGIDVVFDKQATLEGRDADGNEKYADGFYDPESNRIVVNPDSKRSSERLLIHELEHAILKGKKGRALIAKAFKNMDADTRSKIISRYGKFYEGKGLSDAQSAGIMADEVSAHYAEEILSNRHTLEKLIEAEPTLKDRILDFFRGASEDYASDPGLSRAARRYYKTYKKLFDEFSARNFQNNATENSHRSSEISSDGKHHALNDSDVDNSADSRYNYTKEQYEKFGWARANDVLSETENARLRSLFADAVSKQSNPPKTKSGEYMIAVGEDVDNKIAYMTGKIDDPVITRILEIYEYDGTKLSEIKGDLYETEKRGICRETGGIFGLYTCSDFGDYVDAEGSVRKGARHNDQLGAERGTGSRATEKAQGGVRSSPISVVHTFTDISGKRRKVLKVGHEFMIEGNNHAKYAPTIEDAVRAENSRVIDRYARKHNTTAGWVKQKLATDPDFLKKERDRGRRFALNDSDVEKNAENEYNESDDLYTATRNFTKEVIPIDRPLFSRSLANKTAGMKKGEMRTVMILGATRNNVSRIYWFDADGYMHGNMICVDIINDETELKRREYKNGIDGDAEIADLWNDSFPVIGGKSESYISHDEIGRETNPDDRVSADAFPSNRARDFERSRSDYQIDERKIDELIRKLREMYEVPEKNDGGSKRYALSETRESVGKTREPYKPKFKERVFSAKDSIYIDTVDELYGVEKYLRKVGNRRDAAGIVQSVRAYRSQAQAMIGNTQHDIFSEKGGELGAGLQRIFQKVRLRGETVSRDFDDYLLHHLNVDRMTLEQRSIAEQEARQDDLKKKVSELKKLNKRIERLQAEIKALGRSKKDMETKRGLREDLAKAKAEAKALKKEATELNKAVKAFVPLENKPVFGENDSRAKAVTAEESQTQIRRYEEVHPEFRELAEQVWKYNKNLLHLRVEAGLVSADSEALMNQLYPHYVPSFRDVEFKGAATVKGKSNLEISSTIKRAKGGGSDVMSVAHSMAEQTLQVIRAGSVNRLFNAVYAAAIESGDTEYVEIVSRESVSHTAYEANDIETKPKSNQITGYVNGEKVTLSVSRELFLAFEGLNKPTVDPDSSIEKLLARANDGYKKLITAWNPRFLITNPIRDLQDAGINSKHPALFVKNYPIAFKKIFQNSKDWQTAIAHGLFAPSVFQSGDFTSSVDSRGFEAFVKLLDSDPATVRTVFKTVKGAGKNILTAIGNLNAFVEQATRFAEYLASIEAGDSIQTAIYNSAEVSTNFGRRGRKTKKFNATIMPFLNPAIQGFDKMFRNITDAFSSDNVMKALSTLLVKVAAVGLAPMLVNMLMHQDDEDYENLREADKENNFLIKVGDTFVKIPRGRVASVIGGALNRTARVAQGKDADLMDYAANVVNQVTPAQNITRSIFSPLLVDLPTNTTWYGSAIEGRQFENTAPRDRYDESTSSIAITIGQAINYSPKKIHYLLDQYSGVIGDFVLPATTAKAEKDFLSGNFTLDPATSNKLSTEFYEMYDGAQYAKTAGDDTAKYQVRYLNKVKKAINDMYDQKTAIQSNPDLSNAEKLQQSRVVQILINEAYKTALQDFELYTKAIEATAGIESDPLFSALCDDEMTEQTYINLRFTEATRLMYGAERALSEYNSDVYAKCQSLNKAGIDYEMLYNYYFTVRGITSDKDAEGNTISGSKRGKVVSSIKSMKITADQKLLLICASGYAPQDNDLPRMTAAAARKRLLRYILSLKGATQAEKAELAEMCGFEVRNGRVVTKSVLSAG